MTDTEHEVEQEFEMHDIAPLPVNVMNQKFGSDAAAFRSLQTFQPFTAAGAQSPQQLLPRDDFRKEAIICIQDIAVGGQTCFLADSKQAQSGVAGIGFAVPIKGINSAFTFTYKSRQPLWAVADGVNSNNIRISVLDQKYGTLEEE